MFWVITVLIITLFLLWPHWFGAAYENSITRYIWILPPFTFKMTKRRLIILFFNKELKLFNQDKRRRKAVKKKADTQSEEINESVDQLTPSPVETPVKLDSEKQKTITPLPSSVTRNKSEIVAKKEQLDTPSALHEKNSNDTVTTNVFSAEEDSTKTISEPEQEEKTLPKAEIGSDFEIPGYRFIREKIASVKNYLISIWETEKDFIKSNWRWLIRFLKISYRFVKPITFRIKFEGGTGDPAETGTIYGFIQSLSLNRKSYYTNYIEYTPDFGTSPQWKGEGDILWRTSIAAVLLWAFVTLFTFPYIQAYKFYKRRNNGNVPSAG